MNSIHIVKVDKIIQLILLHMIDTNHKIRLTKGQVHNVKGQGQIRKFVKNVSSIYHEPMIGS